MKVSSSYLAQTDAASCFRCRFIEYNDNDNGKDNGRKDKDAIMLGQLVVAVYFELIHAIASGLGDRSREEGGDEVKGGSAGLGRGGQKPCILFSSAASTAATSESFDRKYGLKLLSVKATFASESAMISSIWKQILQVEEENDDLEMIEETGRGGGTVEVQDQFDMNISSSYLGSSSIYFSEYNAFRQDLLLDNEVSEARLLRSLEDPSKFASNCIFLSITLISSAEVNSDVLLIMKCLLRCSESIRYFKSMMFLPDSLVSRMACQLVTLSRSPAIKLGKSAQAIEWNVRSALLALCFREETAKVVRLQACQADQFLELCLHISQKYTNDFIKFVDNSIFSNFRPIHQSAADLLLIKSHWFFSKLSSKSLANLSGVVISCLNQLTSNLKLSSLSESKSTTMEVDLDLDADVSARAFERPSTAILTAVLIVEASSACRVACLTKITEDIGRQSVEKEKSSKSFHSNTSGVLQSLVNLLDSLFLLCCTDTINSSINGGNSNSGGGTNDASIGFNTVKGAFICSFSEDILIRIIQLTRKVMTTLIIFSLVGGNSSSINIGHMNSNDINSSSSSGSSSSGGGVTISDNSIISYICKSYSILHSISIGKQYLTCSSGVRATHELHCLSSYLFFIKMCCLFKDDFSSSQMKLLCAKEMGLSHVKDFTVSLSQSPGPIWSILGPMLAKTGFQKLPRKIISEFSQLTSPLVFSQALERPGDWLSCLHLLVSIDVFKSSTLVDSDFFVSKFIEGSVFPVHSLAMDVIDLLHKRNASRQFSIGQPPPPPPPPPSFGNISESGSATSSSSSTSSSAGLVANSQLLSRDIARNTSSYDETDRINSSNSKSSSSSSSNGVNSTANSASSNLTFNNIDSPYPRSLSYYPNIVYRRCAALRKFPLIDLNEIADIKSLHRVAVSYQLPASNINAREHIDRFSHIRRDDSSNSIRSNRKGGSDSSDYENSDLGASRMSVQMCSMCSKPALTEIAFSIQSPAVTSSSSSTGGDADEEIVAVSKQILAAAGSTPQPLFLTQALEQAMKLSRSLPFKSLPGQNKYCNCRSNQTSAGEALGEALLHNSLKSDLNSHQSGDKSLLPGILSMYSSLRLLLTSQVLQCSKLIVPFACDVATLPIKNCISLLMTETLRCFGNSCSLLCKIVPLAMLYCEDLLVVNGFRPGRDKNTLADSTPQFIVGYYNRTLIDCQSIFTYYRDMIMPIELKGLSSNSSSSSSSSPPYTAVDDSSTSMSGDLVKLTSQHSLVDMLNRNSNCYLISNSEQLKQRERSEACLTFLLSHQELRAAKHFNISMYALLPEDTLNSIMCLHLLPQIAHPQWSGGLTSSDKCDNNLDPDDRGYYSNFPTSKRRKVSFDESSNNADCDSADDSNHTSSGGSLHRQRQEQQQPIVPPSQLPSFTTTSSAVKSLTARECISMFCDIFEAHPRPHELALLVSNFFFSASAMSFGGSHVSLLRSFQQLVEEPLVLLRLPSIYLQNPDVLFILMYMIKNILYKQAEVSMKLRIYSMKKVADVMKASAALSMNASKVSSMTSVYPYIESKVFSSIQWIIFAKMLLVCGASSSSSDTNHGEYGLTVDSNRAAAATTYASMRDKDVYSDFDRRNANRSSTILPIIFDMIYLFTSEVDNFFEILLDLGMSDAEMKVLCKIPSFSHQILQCLVKKLRVSNNLLSNNAGREVAAGGGGGVNLNISTASSSNCSSTNPSTSTSTVNSSALSNSNNSISFQSPQPDSDLPFSQIAVDNFVDFEKLLSVAVLYTKLLYINSPTMYRNSSCVDSSNCLQLFNSSFLSLVIDFILFGHIKFISCFHPMKYITSINDLTFELYDVLSSQGSPLAIVLLASVYEESSDLKMPLNYGIKRLKDAFKSKLGPLSDKSQIEIAAVRAAKISLLLATTSSSSSSSSN